MHRLKIPKFKVKPSKRLFKTLASLILTLVISAGAFSWFARPSLAAWWTKTEGGGSWLKRQNTPLVNNSGDSLASGTTVAVTVDTQTLVSQGRLQSDCDDLRIVYQNGSNSTELTRYLSYPGGNTCSTSQATKVYFKLSTALADGSSNADEDYYIYYHNTQAAAPTSTVDAFDTADDSALLVCPFDGTTTCINGDGTEDPTTATGAIRYSGAKSAISFMSKSDYVSLTNPPDDATKPLTMETWFKMPSLTVKPGGGTAFLLGGVKALGCCTGSDAIQFNLDGSGNATGLTGKIAFNNGGDATHATISFNYSFQADTWYHVAMQVDSSGTMKIYLDGQLQNSGSMNASLRLTTTSFAIGTTSGNPTSYDSNVIIDETRISTIDRYASNFTSQTSPFVRDEYTTVLYHFDENGDDPWVTGKVIDDSGNSNHGTVTGAKYVAGLVGVDNGVTNTGNVDGGNTYAGHEGIFIEEATTNKITNPSFEHATYSTGWSTASASGTFSENTTAPYYKFGSKSAKILVSGGDASILDTVNTGATTHTLSAYVYDGTTGNVGGTVDATIANLMFAATPVTTTYTNMGGGWWRLSYSGTGVASDDSYGVTVKDTKTVYIDGVQLEEKSYTTTYTDGSLTSDAGGTNTYFWDDDCDRTLDSGEDETADQNTQCSSRTIATFKYDASASNISPTAGTVSFWIKKQALPRIGTWENYLFAIGNQDSTNSLTLEWNVESPGNAQMIARYGNSTDAYNGDVMVYEAAHDPDDWIDGAWRQYVLTWNTNDFKLYFNGSQLGSTDSSLTTNATFSSKTFDLFNNFKSGQFVKSDLRIFNSALTSTEVADLYYSGLVSHSQTYEVDAFSENKGQNPVGIYHFDEGYGSTAHDSSVYSNDLTVTGATWDNTSGGYSTQIARTLKFDGSDDMASASATIANEMNFGTGNFSLSSWFKHSSTASGTDTLISKYSSAGYQVYMNSSGYLCFGIDDDSSWGPDDSACTTVSYADSKWHHMEAVRDTSAIYLNIDGNRVAYDDSLSATGTLNNTANFAVGVSSAKDNYWDGFVDEIFVYPYARSGDQVKNDYMSSQTSAVLGSQSSDPLTQGLVGYWKMDEIATPSLDSSGNGYSAGWANSPVSLSGKYGNGLSFAGTGDYIEANAAQAQESQTLTVTAYIYITETNNYDGFVGHFNGNPSHCWSYHLGTISGNKLQFVSQNGSTTVASLGSASTIPLNQWVNVAFTYNGSLVSLYINGVKDANTTSLSSITYSGSPQATRIGRGDYEFNGSIDEVRIYNRALSPAEVSQLYNWAPGPVGYWKLNENTGTTAYDSSGNGNTSSTWTGNTKWVSGKYGGGLSFDGNDDVVRIAETGTTDLGALTNSYTLESWFKTNTTYSSGNGVIACKNANDSTYPYCLFIESGSNAVAFRLYGGSAAYAVSPTAYNDGQWHHVAGIRDVSTDKVYLYVDGVLVAQGNDDTTTSSANNSDISLGNAWNSYTDRDFNGLIDEVRLYNYVRTPSQIIEDMNAGHPAPGSPIGSAVAHWRFDEGYSSTAYDASTNTLNLTLSSASWTNEGKFGKGWNGDGAKWLSITDANSGGKLDFTATESATFTTWVKSDAAGNPSGNEYILNKADATTTGYAIYFDNAGKPVFAVDDDTSWTPDFSVTGTADVYDGSWHQITAVKTEGTKLDLYIDGALNNTSTVSIPNGDLNNSLAFYVGDRDGTDNGDEFTGDIDEVQIFRFALTPDQAKLLNNQGQSAVFGSISSASSSATMFSSARSYCPPGDTNTCNPPVGEWKFDENSGTAAYDNSSNGNTGSIGDGTPSYRPTWVTGKQGSGLNFDGVDDIVKVTTSASITDVFDGGGTVETWVKLSPQSGTKGIITDNGLQFMVEQSGNNFRIEFDFNRDTVVGGWITSYINPINQWTHLAVTYDATPTNTDPIIYINGVSQSVSEWQTPQGTRTASGPYLIFGRQASSYVKGVIDEIKLYDYTRTPAQIAWDYNQGAPVAHYRFDECSGSTAYDTAPKSDRGVTGYNGTITPGASGNTSVGSCSSGVSTEMWNDGTTGKYSSSLGFDGTDDNVCTSSVVSNLVNDFSASAWVKWNGSNSSDQIILNNGQYSTDGWYIFVDFSDSNQVAILGENAGTTNSDFQLPTDSWTHIAVTRSGGSGGMWKIYANGKIIPITNASGYTLWTPTTRTCIGARQNGNPYDTFNGQIDDVRIYNYALTPEQVKTDYSNGVVRF